MDYEALGLDRYLIKNSTLSNNRQVDSYVFDSQNERNAISGAKLKNFSFNAGTGGTLTLGGQDNQNGVMNIRDSSGNTIVTIDVDGLHGYLSSGTETLRVSANGVQGFGLDGDMFTYYDAPGGTLYGQQGYYSLLNSFYFKSNNGKSLYLASDFEWYGVSGDDMQLNANGVIQITNIGAGGGADILIDSDDDIIFTCTDFVVNGTTKTAIVQTTEGYNSLYCAEAPDVWFFDFCEGRKKRNLLTFWKTEWEIKPDPMFEEVTLKPYIIMETLNKGTVQVWGKRKDTNAKRFESKTKAEFNSNNKFWGQAHNFS